MDDLPISFCWTTPKMKKNGTCITYCFSFIRDPTNYHVLHAGVKYFGKYSNLRAMRTSLRKTAVERLLKKPIISSVCTFYDISPPLPSVCTMYIVHYM